MKKSAFITMGACALAGIAYMRIQHTMRRSKRSPVRFIEPNPAGLFV